MGSLLVALFVFAVVVGVKHKAQHHDSDLPDSVISGSKSFVQDLLVVLKSLKPSKKDKSEDKEEVAELPKGESEEKPVE